MKRHDIELKWVIEVDVPLIDFVDAFTEFLESHGWYGGGTTGLYVEESTAGLWIPQKDI